MWNPILTWTWNLFILFSSDYFDGYKGIFTALFGSSFAWVDASRGILGWEVYFNIGLTRLIAFNLDYYWMRNNRPISQHKKTELFIRQETHAPAGSFTLLHFLGYYLYIPLYLAGPVLNYNAWISQVRQPQRTHSLRRIIGMTAAVIFYTYALSISLGYYYQFSINERREYWSKEDAWGIARTGLLTLTYMYMKFLIIWRTFRCFGLWDGIDTQENMVRCVNNNFTFAGFWRSWHASMHNWIIRYLYLPLGGSRTQIYTVWLIFLFIGLWHDLWLRWVAWALFNGVFFSGEILVKLYFAQPKWGWLQEKWYYGWVLGTAGFLDILFLMVTNLAIIHGFADSLLFFEKFAMQPESPWLLLSAYASFCIGANTMTKIRQLETEEEHRTHTKKQKSGF